MYECRISNLKTLYRVEKAFSVKYKVTLTPKETKYHQILKNELKMLEEDGKYYTACMKFPDFDTPLYIPKE